MTSTRVNAYADTEATVGGGWRLREETPPQEHIVVIRGGIIENRTDDELRKRATDAEARLGLLAQSVLLTPESDLVHVCQSDGRVSRYGHVNLSTVARLRQAGFALLPTLDAPHYSVVLPDASPETLQRFRSCFDWLSPAVARVLEIRTARTSILILPGAAEEHSALLERRSPAPTA